MLYTGHNLWPLKFVTQLYNLAAASPALNVSLHTRTPVTAMTRSGSANHSAKSYRHPLTLSTPRGSISCTRVIHATNAYVSHLLPHLRGPTGVIPIRGQVMALRAAAPLQSISRHAWTGNEGFEYWFPRPLEHGKEHPLVIIGGGRDATQPDYGVYVADDSEVNVKAGNALRKFLPTLFPGKYAEGREPEMEWTGIMGYTATGGAFVSGRYVTFSSEGEHTLFYRLDPLLIPTILRTCMRVTTYPQGLTGTGCRVHLVGT